VVTRRLLAKVGVHRTPESIGGRRSKAMRMSIKRAALAVAIVAGVGLSSGDRASAQVTVTTVQSTAPGVIGYVPERVGLFGWRTGYRPIVGSVPVRRTVTTVQQSPAYVATPVVVQRAPVYVAPPAPVAVQRAPVYVAPAPVVFPVATTTYLAPMPPAPIPVTTYYTPVYPRY
jgi:hypothetical protein